MRGIIFGIMCVLMVAAAAQAQYVEIPLVDGERAYLSCHTILQAMTDGDDVRVTVCDWATPVIVLDGAANPQRTHGCWDYLSPAPFDNITAEIKFHCQ